RVGRPGDLPRNLAAGRQRAGDERRAGQHAPTVPRGRFPLARRTRSARKDGILAGERENPVNRLLPSLVVSRCNPAPETRRRPMVPDTLDHREGPRDECGVFGVYAPGHDVSKLAYYGLYALQHRGQESAGIAA